MCLHRVTVLRNKRLIFWLLVALLAIRVTGHVSSPAGLNWDFTGFYNTGARVFQGEIQNIYKQESPIAGKPRELTKPFEYVGFPLSAYLFAPLGLFSTRVGLLVFKVVCAACYGLGLFLLYRHFHTHTLPGWNMELQLNCFLFLCLVFEPFWRVFPVGGQSTPFAFLMLVMFLSAYVKSRLAAAALFLSVAILVKPFLGPVVYVFLLARDWKFLMWLTGTFTLEGSLSLSLVGPGLHWEWIRIVLQESQRWSMAWWYNCSILGFAANFWRYLQPLRSAEIVPPALFVIQIVFRSFLVLFFARLVQKVRTTSAPELPKKHSYVLLGIVLSLFIPGIVWEHYLVFLIIPLLYLISYRQDIPRGAQTVTVLILLLTLRANQLFARSLSVRFMYINSFWETLLVSSYGSGALILTLLLLLYFYRSGATRFGAAAQRIRLVCTGS